MIHSSPLLNKLDVYAAMAIQEVWVFRDGVFTLYGRLATGTIARGERVAIGDRVGTLGESPEDEVAGLYFEIRDARASVDPALWLR